MDKEVMISFFFFSIFCVDRKKKTCEKILSRWREKMAREEIYGHRTRAECEQGRGTSCKLTPSSSQKLNVMVSPS